MKALLRCKMDMEKHNPYIAMIFIQFVYAGMALLSKAAVNEGTKPSVFVAYRQGFAALALAPFAFFLESNKTAPLSCYLLCKIFFVSLCGITMALNLYYYAITYISATFATAMTNTIPATVFVMAVALRMERVSMKQWDGITKVLGCAVGLSGAMVYTFFKGPPIYSSMHKEVSKESTKYISKEDWIKGALFMLAANIAWSLWLIMQGSIVKQYPAKIRFTTLQCFFSCISSAIWAVVVDRNLSSWKLGWDINLLSVLYCGIIVTGITYWLQVWAVEKKGPVFTAMFSPLALILTAFFSAIFFQETLHWGSFGFSFLWQCLWCCIAGGRSLQLFVGEEQRRRRKGKR
ncbi:WAT1-related protein At1g43650-like isoform X2 [Cornus florida]|uniref:WAT1-related protein At1g43650-like isoform X2 n=1 Tax=Cornus florida TaxID=4283 RepID=UPI0028979FC3|nr:WAT1-related protein At1g43650-like isoform X2 [Cornus florida]